MSNRQLHNFIKSKLNEIANADAENTFLFGAEHLYSYINGSLTLNVKNYTTLRIDKKEIIPFTILAYDGERVPLESVKIFKHVLPIVFSLRYEYLDTWESYIEDFADSLNGKTFDVGGVNTAFSVSNVSPTSVEKQLDAEDWVDVTITVFGYQGDMLLGNDVDIVINGETIEPLSYTSQLQNEMSYNTPSNINYGVNVSNSKQHIRRIVFLQTLSGASTWINEIENDMLNTSYTFNVTYNLDTPIVANRNMLLDTGTISVANGTAVLLELVFVDG